MEVKTGKAAIGTTLECHSMPAIVKDYVHGYYYVKATDGSDNDWMFAEDVYVQYAQRVLDDAYYEIHETPPQEFVQQHGILKLDGYPGECPDSCGCTYYLSLSDSPTFGNNHTCAWLKELNLSNFAYNKRFTNGKEGTSIRLTIFESASYFHTIERDSEQPLGFKTGNRDLNKLFLDERLRTNVPVSDVQDSFRLMFEALISSLQSRCSLDGITLLGGKTLAFMDSKANFAIKFGDTSSYQGENRFEIYCGPVYTNKSGSRSIYIDRCSISIPKIEKETLSRDKFISLIKAEFNQWLTGEIEQVHDIKVNPIG